MNDSTISLEQKKVLLKMVLDDVSFNSLKTEEINEAFSYNLANIIISTRGEF